MSLYLCVDCGGSKTAVAIADASGAILARATGGPSNYAYIGLTTFLSTIRSSVSAALASTASSAIDESIRNLAAQGLPPPADKPLFASAWLGVSGVDSPSAIAALTPPLTSLLGVHPIVCNDTHLLAAPMRLYDDVEAAIACVSGTGGIVAGFKQNDESTGGDKEVLREIGRVGGWGWILGDEGGGYHVGREAVRKILEQADRAPIDEEDESVPNDTALNGSVNGDDKKAKLTLRDRICDWFGITDVYELLTIVHMADPDPTLDSDSPLHSKSDASKENKQSYLSVKREKRLSSLAPLVFASAFEDGDPLAMTVLRTAASSLAEQISVFLLPPLPNHSPDSSLPDQLTKPPPSRSKKVYASQSILCFGGSLAGVTPFRQLVLDELHTQGGHVFRRVQVVEDAAEAGAKALVAAAAGRG